MKRKRICWMAFMLCLVVGKISGCGKQSVVGIWYSDRDDTSTITLNDDGTYTDGVWLTSGEYTIEEDEIILTSILDGQHTLLIQEDDDGDTILYFENGDYSHTYYSDKNKAEQAISDRQQAKQEKADQQETEEKALLEKALIGYWIPISSESYPITFSKDGTFISYDLYGNTDHSEQTGSYEVTQGNIVTVTRDGKAMDCKAEINNDGTMEFNGGKSTSITYRQAEPIALSLDILVGEWNNRQGISTMVFTENNTYYSTNDAQIGKPEETSFTITNDNMITMDGETQWAFLSETDTEYQLLISRKINPNFDTTYITLFIKEKGKNL